MRILVLCVQESRLAEKEKKKEKRKGKILAQLIATIRKSSLTCGPAFLVM